MEKYHIYGEIGQGPFSQVFKGREKKKIEYVAIKRVDKAGMNKIANEIQIMHKLNSPHILKFHDWYETRNNLWLILEYCTGADLESLLKRDGHLPEASVRMIGLDILAALQYIHHCGILHCDLRPRNFLIDEYGILKIADFKFARKIPKATLGNEPLDTRGTYAYMAPELFTPDGLHSFSSDFWSLGCVLYEMRRGIPPFGYDGNVELNVLLERIQTAEPVATPIVFMEVNNNNNNSRKNNNNNNNNSSSKRGGNKNNIEDRDRMLDKSNYNSSGLNAPCTPAMSADLADLLLWMLEKSPAHRCCWTDLTVHPFWGDRRNQTPKNLPAQAVFENLIRNYEKDRSLKLETESYMRVGLDISDAAKVTRLPSPIPDKTPLRQPLAPSTGTHDNNGTMKQQTDTTRQRTDGGIGAILIAESKLQNTIKQQQQSSRASGNSDYSDGFETFDDEQSATSNVTHGNKQMSSYTAPSSSLKDATSIASDSDHKSHGSTNKQMSYSIERVQSDSFIAPELNVFLLLMHVSDGQVKPVVGNNAIEVLEKPIYKASALPIAALHADDIGNMPTSDIESHISMLYKLLLKYCLPSNTTAPSSQTTSSSIPMNANALNERNRLLSYLCNIASSAEVANLILNTQFLYLLLKLVKATIAESATTAKSFHSSTLSRGGSPATSNSSNLIQSVTLCRTLAATSLATILRFSTYIQPPQLKQRDDHIIPVLISILKDGAKVDSKLKRRTVAALGELVFYISSQDESSGASDHQWILPSGIITIILKCLKDETDEIVRHYAAKSVENVLAQGNMEYKRKFANIDIAIRLLEMSQHARNESLQATCGMALSHLFYLVMTNEPSTATPSSDINAGAKFISRVLDKGGLPHMIDTLKDGQPKLQQAYLNIINIIFTAENLITMGNNKIHNDASSAGPNSAAAAAVNQVLKPLQYYFVKSQPLVPTLLRLVEQGGSLAVRAKALITIQCLCKHNPAVLTEHRLPVALMRIIEPYMIQQPDNEGNSSSGSNANHSNTSTYNIKVGLSMVFFIRSKCVVALEGIDHQLNFIASYKGSSSSSSSSSSNAHLVTPERTPSKDRSGIAGRTPYTMTRQTPLSVNTISSKHSSNSNGSNPVPAATVASVGNEVVVNVTLCIQQLSQFSDVLRSTVSIAAQPALGRLILGTGSSLCTSLSSVLRKLSAVRKYTTSIPSSNEKDSIIETLELVEQASLFALESIAQVDVCDALSGICLDSNHLPSNISKYVPDKDAGYAFVTTVVTKLLPSAGALALHPDGDVRVLIAASLRRLVPSALRALLLVNLNDDISCLLPYLEHVPSLLVDQSPIPQYTIRLLSDAFNVSPSIASGIVKILHKNGGYNVLIKTLKGYLSNSNIRYNDDDEDKSCDNSNSNKYTSSNSNYNNVVYDECFSEFLKNIQSIS